jgi:hypothetical protein
MRKAHREFFTIQDVFHVDAPPFPEEQAKMVRATSRKTEILDLYKALNTGTFGSEAPRSEDRLNTT